MGLSLKPQRKRRGFEGWDIFRRDKYVRWGKYVAKTIQSPKDNTHVDTCMYILSGIELGESVGIRNDARQQQSDDPATCREVVSRGGIYAARIQNQHYPSTCIAPLIFAVGDALVRIRHLKCSSLSWDGARHRYSTWRVAGNGRLFGGISYPYKKPRRHSESHTRRRLDKLQQHK